ncbi:hypothetical protein GE09DRAFT_1108449 [Coniochaeta sp. 2T2.1]|nr:hypothetical protein GE09DRAFT_1108449 [Coniochaeta sp. 2T2.1]
MTESENSCRLRDQVQIAITMPRDRNENPSHRELSEGERQPPAGELTDQQGYRIAITIPRDRDGNPSHRELSEGERQPPAGELTYQQGYRSPLTQLDNWEEQLGPPQGSPHWSQVTPEGPQSHRQSPVAWGEPATWHDNIPGHSPAGLDEVLLGSGLQSTRSSSQDVVEIDSTAFYPTRRQSSHEMHHAAGNPTNPSQDQRAIAPHLPQSGGSKGKDKEKGMDKASKHSLASSPSSTGSTASHNRRGQPSKRGRGEPSQPGISEGKGKEKGTQQGTPELHEAIGRMSSSGGERTRMTVKARKREEAKNAIKNGLGFARLDSCKNCIKNGYSCWGEDVEGTKRCYQCRASDSECVYVRGW